MALIGKIRNNFWFVLLLLGFALAAFVIMDMVNAGNQGGLGPKQIIGEVAGKSIDYTDFQRAEQALYSGGTDSYASKASTWNYLTEKAIIEGQAEDIGVDVSVAELMDLQFGANLSPVIQSVYRNPQTGQVDRQSLLGVQQAIEAGDELNPDFELRWQQLQKQIIKTAKQDKINTLVAKSIFTPTFLAENTGKRSSQTVNFEYVKIPFDNIDDSAVEISDSDISSYLSNNAFKYTNDEETRVVEYTVFDVFPTKADSMAVKAQLEGIANTFREKTTSAEDSIYVINNEGFYSPIFAREGDLSGSIKGAVSTMNVGDVYGPYLDNGAYFIAKLTGKAVVADTVTASHILRSATEGDAASFAAARSYVDSLRNLIERRTATFEDLATDNSQDPGSAARGGELDPFVQGAMVPEFNEAAFLSKKESGLHTVQTRFGIHLINVKKRKYNDRDTKYRIALIRSAITPSDGTQNAVYEVVDQVISENRTLDALKAAAQAKGMTVSRSSALKANDYLFGTLGGGETSREIIKWGFDDTSVGTVSPTIYTYNDPVNYFNSKYVLIGLSNINSPGLAKVADVRDNVSTVVRNLKKGDVIVSKVSGSDLSSIASSFDASVETASNVAFTAGGVTGLGNEPEVLSVAFAQADGGVSKPIVGNNGVYVVKTISKTEGTAPANVLAQKSTLNSTNRGRVNFSLINALKEKFKTTDNRSKYF